MSARRSVNQIRLFALPILRRVLPEQEVDAVALIGEAVIGELWASYSPD